ncbi:hypothetical protein SSPS47_34920 [Streptomyces sp. S4.7]|uniref:hypothetical protein n=1 Tax=Streptomyces sp. S4.7 TaxID=2705439 RepID=UPI001397A79C|nr:hypothetical protein [Streptomyces sp. S4.7]QHZ00296.1 hypothetical protein SSPS47_34920 [Streptomyces sp. S4.7]
MAFEGTAAGTPAAVERAVDLAVGLPGRTGVIGGVESLVLDGRRLFFGFDFSSDQVLSPLIDDGEAMARFAARHMRQRTGAHDEVYWAQLVRASVDGSDLVWRDEQRTFTSGALETGNAGAAHGHLPYLLDAATVGAADDTAGAHQAMGSRSTVANWSLLFAPYTRGTERSAGR